MSIFYIDNPTQYLNLTITLLTIILRLNAWIWLADERSEVCNYFQGNAQRT